MPTYQAFGLAIGCNQPVAAFAGIETRADNPDVVVSFVPMAEWASTTNDEADWHQTVPDDAGNALCVTRSAAGTFRFVYSDGIEFLVDADGSTVSATWPAGLTLDDAVEYLVGPVLGFVLRLKKVECLHAAAIAAGDGCFAILVPGGRGKSTTTAACARLGFPILTEDVLVLEQRGGRFFVAPGYPRVRLWPTAVEGLFGSADALPRITPDNDAWKKRYLDLNGPGYSFQRAPLPLHAIYTHDAQQSTTARFETLTPAAALVTLLSNNYTLVRPYAEQRALEFDSLQQLANAVPVKRYQGRYGIEHLDAQCRALHDDCIRSAAAVRA